MMENPNGHREWREYLLPFSVPFFGGESLLVKKIPFFSCFGHGGLEPILTWHPCLKCDAF
jgi:hypothetical protein